MNSELYSKHHVSHLLVETGAKCRIGGNKAKYTTNCERIQVEEKERGCCRQTALKWEREIEKSVHSEIIVKEGNHSEREKS